MSDFWYEVIVYLCEAVISGVFLLNLLKPKYNLFLTLILWCYIVFLLLFVTPVFSFVRILIIALAEFIFTLFLYDDKRKKKVGMYLFKQGIMLLSSLSSFIIYSNVVGVTVRFRESCTSENCTYSLLYLITFSVLTSVISQFLKRASGIEFPWVVGTQLVIGIGEFCSILSVAGSANGVINATKSTLILIASIAMVASNVSIGMLAPYLLNQISEAKNIDYSKELSNMEYKYYEMSVENDRKMVSIRHDIANQIQTAYSLFEIGDNVRGMAIINQLKEQYLHVEKIVYCNNPVVNIIISNKRREAEEKNIDTQIRIKDDLDNLPITDFDLSTVICNLLDNAIRGCICSEQSSPRLIIEMLCKNQYLVIRILNSCKAAMNIEDTDKIKTTQSTSQNHGIGMTIVSGIAQKYRGDFVVSARNGIFTATVVMSIK